MLRAVTTFIGISTYSSRLVTSRSPLPHPRQTKTFSVWGIRIRSHSGHLASTWTNILSPPFRQVNQFGKERLSPALPVNHPAHIATKEMVEGDYRHLGIANRTLHHSPLSSSETLRADPTPADMTPVMGCFSFTPPALQSFGHLPFLYKELILSVLPDYIFPHYPQLGRREGINLSIPLFFL